MKLSILITFISLQEKRTSWVSWKSKSIYWSSLVSNHLHLSWRLKMYLTIFTNIPWFSFAVNKDSEDEHKKYTRDYCEALTNKIANLQDAQKIPNECKEFASVREELIRRRDSNRHDHAIAFEGMNSGQALSAMAAREQGHLNPCQVQRRFTNRRPSDRRVW